MAKLNTNMLVKGARGHVGKQFVFKQIGNKTVIAKMPEIRKGLVASNDQVKVRDQFSAAAVYASGAMTDPILKSEYQKKAGRSKTAYNVAFRDYLKAPVVSNIDAEQYNGSAGSPITVYAKDDFRVMTVTVSITDANGSLVEQGEAVMHPIDRNRWIYTSTQLLADISGASIAAVATDIPGNKGRLQVIL